MHSALCIAMYTKLNGQYYDYRARSLSLLAAPRHCLLPAAFAVPLLGRYSTTTYRSRCASACGMGAARWRCSDARSPGAFESSVAALRSAVAVVLWPWGPARMTHGRLVRLASQRRHLAPRCAPLLCAYRQLA